MVSIVIIPGWQDASPGHWQNLWSARFANTVRVEQDERISPLRQPWVDTIARALLAQPGPVVVAAHGLGCIAVTHLPPEAVARIHGALLVAPVDPERRGAWADFCPVPATRLPYRNILVASSNDPNCPVRLAGAYARGWGSEFVRLPDAGHIDTQSGHGDWPLGAALLQSLAGERRLRLRRHAPATSSITPFLNLEPA